MGQVLGIIDEEIMAQAKAMTEVALVFAPVVSVITTIVSVVTLVLSGKYLLI